jgi:sugar O-acyltransferase (sialic acid O-acetyltransferase NeuD family)
MDVIVFGLGQLSRLAWYQLTHDSPHRVVAFTVDAAYRTEDTFNGLPVVPFEELVVAYPPGQVSLFLPLSYRNQSSIRREKYRIAKSRGYGFVSHISSSARVARNAKVGENVYIDDGAVVGPFSSIGDNCMILPGAVISHDVTLWDHGFVAAGAVVGGGTEIGEQCVLALNCTVLNGIKLAPRCLIGAGAVLTGDTEENGIYVGVPARRLDKPALKAGAS